MHIFYKRRIKRYTHFQRAATFHSLQNTCNAFPAIFSHLQNCQLHILLVTLPAFLDGPKIILHEDERY
jgi:hypothetical protein